MVRHDSLSALRLTPPISAGGGAHLPISAGSPYQPISGAGGGSGPYPSQQPLHARLQIDIEVDQRTGSARIDSWSPVGYDSAPAGVGYSNYGQYHWRIL